MDAFDMELYEAVSRLDAVLAKYGERVREIVVTPHLRPPMTLNTAQGSVLVLFGDGCDSPWIRAMHARAALEQALREADERVAQIVRETDAERTVAEGAAKLILAAVKGG